MEMVTFAQQPFFFFGVAFNMHPFGTGCFVFFNKSYRPFRHVHIVPQP